MVQSENGQWFSLIAFIFIFVTMGDKLFYIGEITVYHSAEYMWNNLFPNLSSWTWGHHSS